MFETAIPGVGYGSATQQVGLPLGNYGNPFGQFGQQFGPQGTGAFGQPSFGGPAGGQAGILAQRFASYQTPQSVLPLTIAPGTIPFQQIQSPFGQPQLGQWPWGQPSLAQLQIGQPQIGQPQWGQPQFGQPSFGQQPFAGQQLGMTQPQIQLPQVQVIPVVTPHGGFGVLLLATGQPLVIGAGSLLGGLGQYPGYGTPWQGLVGGGQTGLGGQIGGLAGGYLPLQVQPQIPQQVPQMYGPTMPVGTPNFPGQPFGPMPIH
jgi:hypothetical protein